MSKLWDDLKENITASVKKEIGPHSKPDKIQFTSALPKTRSGKIMRRILRKIAEGDLNSMGDISTLEDPSVVDKLIKKKNFKTTNFEIRFHLLPKSKVTKTQDGNVILIEFETSGWKFSANNHLIDVESGLYFGNKNSFVENQNLFISGTTQEEDQIIKWSFEKIS